MLSGEAPSVLHRRLIVLITAASSPNPQYHSNSTTRSPCSTNEPASRCTAFTLPSAAAVIVLFIFIASKMNSGVSFFTASPGLTEH